MKTYKDGPIKCKRSKTQMKIGSVLIYSASSSLLRSPSSCWQLQLTLGPMEISANSPPPMTQMAKAVEPTTLSFHTSTLPRLTSTYINQHLESMGDGVRLGVSENQ